MNAQRLLQMYKNNMLFYLSHERKLYESVFNALKNNVINVFGDVAQSELFSPVDVITVILHTPFHLNRT